MRFRWTRMRAGRLRLLVMAVADRCDQRCVHCDIWRGEGGGAGLGLEERLRIVDEALSAGALAALLTGGEPLLAAHLWPIAQRLRKGGARVMLATNGMLLESFADRVAEGVDEVYVSLDGADPSTHDRLRGVPAFARLRAGVAALARRAPRPKLVARSVLHAANLETVEAVVDRARALGFDQVSFLALDASSSAFGGRISTRTPLLPDAAQVGRFRVAVARLEDRGVLGGEFVVESRVKLEGIADHLRASALGQGFVRPACDAPLWSSVVEADGKVRPCFFHDAVGDAREGLTSLRASEAYAAALARIRGPNPTCERCVCPKLRGSGLLARRSA